MRRLLPLAQATLLVGLALAVLCVPYLPTHDGPQHVFTVHAANHLDAPGTGWSRWLDPNANVSSYGFSTLFTPFDLLLPWRSALRISLALAAVLWGLGACVLARSVHPERGWLGLAVGAAALQWVFYMGFFSFYIASAFGLLVLAFALRSPPGPRRDLVLAALLLAQALFHLVAAAFTGLVVAMLGGLRAPPGRRKSALLRVALVGAPAAAVALCALAIQLTLGEEALRDPEGRWRYHLAPLWTLAKCVAGGPAWRAWPLTLAAMSSPLLALATGLRARSVEDRALLASGTLFLALAALLPLHLPNWDFFSVRFAAPGVCLLVLALPVERLPRWPQRAVALAAVLFAAASTGWGAIYHHRLLARTAQALSGLQAGIRSDGARLPIVLDPFAGRSFDDSRAPIPYFAPLLNLGKLYALEQGGMVPYAFDSDPSIHSVLLSEWGRENLPPAPDPRGVVTILAPENAHDLARREALTLYLASQGTNFDDVILWGRPEDADHLLWLGFDARWRNGGLLIARFRGCPRTLRFGAEAPIDDTDVLELGWYPSLETTHWYTLGGAQRAPDGSRVLPMRQSCGSLWVRFEDPSLACDGADAEGRWVLPPARSSDDECRVVRRNPSAVTRSTQRGESRASGS